MEGKMKKKKMKERRQKFKKGEEKNGWKNEKGRKIESKMKKEE